MHATNSINVPIAVNGVDGNPDATTVVRVSSGSAAVRVGVLPADNRMAFIDGISPTSGGGANVILTVTEGGVDFTDSFLVSVGAAPNRGSISAGSVASAEYQTPSSR